MKRCFALLLLVGWESQADAETATSLQKPLEVVIAAPSVGSGAIVQVRLGLPKPIPLSWGSIEMTFDPAVFGRPIAADVFSAAGDQTGYVSIAADRVRIEFRADSGGIGRLPGVPALVVTLPVIATGAITTSLRFSAGEKPWKDVYGNQYTVAAQTAQFRVAGNFSIAGVTPGGGLLPAGTAVRIAGRGFTPSSTVRIDGVALLSSQFRGPNEIEITLTDPLDLTSRRVVVSDPVGGQADFFPAQRVDWPCTSATDWQFIFPQRLSVRGSLGLTNYYYALQNPSLDPVRVTLTQTATSSKGFSGTGDITISPGGTYCHTPGPSLGTSSVSFTSSRPLRRGSFDYPGGGEGMSGLSVAWPNGVPRCSDRRLGSSPEFACWLGLRSSNVGEVLRVSWHDEVPFSVTATTEGGQWLMVSPERGTACVTGRAACSGGDITLKANVSSLAPGDYQGVVTIQPDDPVLLPVAVPFVMRVAESLVSLKDAPPYLFFNARPTDSPPPPVHLEVTATSDGTPFTVAVDPEDSSWLVVSPKQGVTPAKLDVTIDPPQAVGRTRTTAFVVVNGPANSVSEIVGFSIAQPPALYFDHGPRIFWAKSGGPNPPPQNIRFSLSHCTDSCNSEVRAAVEEEGEGGWLKATPIEPNSMPSAIEVAVDVTGLAPGVYAGKVKVGVPTRPEYPPFETPVTLTVWGGEPAIDISPASVELTLPSGSSETSPPLIAVRSGPLPVAFTSTVSTEDGNQWLSVRDDYHGPAPYGSAYVFSDAQNLPPGIYRGAIQIHAPPGTSTPQRVPVTLKVTAATMPYPVAGPAFPVSLVNAASQAVGPIAAGEILTIHGLNFVLPPPGRKDEVSVFIDDVKAPLLYTGPTQVNLAVPYEIASKRSVRISVEADGVRSMTSAAVASSAPGVFTADGSGVGQAAAWNADGSVNSASNPASRGSILRVLATGLGQTTPTGTTGRASADDGRKPVLPVTARVGGLAAPVQRVRLVPNQLGDIFEIDIYISAEVPAGPAVSVVVSAGSTASGGGVTMAVR
ncbi:MAG: IPT/TIG domain-containing protein [Bryobacterales bacterium]|nr:IPT/TIG domain-containing protein [Bryobacterales bacterium]